MLSETLAEGIARYCQGQGGNARVYFYSGFDMIEALTKFEQQLNQVTKARHSALLRQLRAELALIRLDQQQRGKKGKPRKLPYRGKQR